MKTQFPERFRCRFLVHVGVQRLLDLALTTPTEVADLFVQYSPHVEQVSVRGFAGGWKRDVLPDFDVEAVVNAADAEDQVRKLLEAMENFVYEAPAIAAKKEADRQEAARLEREAFAAAVRAHYEAREAGVDAEILKSRAIECSRLLDSMTAETRGIWWDEKHGTWGVGPAPWAEGQDEEISSEAICSGPHS